MVIKSISRTSKSFHQLLHYMAGESRVPGVAIRHNLGGSAQDLEAVNRAFMANAKHCPKRKGGVMLYHEILSLSPEDRDQATPEMLADLAEHYLILRAPEALAYGAVHFDAHPHVHLMISANQRGRSQKIRCSRSGFAQIKRSLEAYQRVKYPQLSHSLVFGEEGKVRREVKEKRKREASASASVRKRTRSARQQGLREVIEKTLPAARSLEDWVQRLNLQQIGVYQRGGKLAGIVSQGKKYRLRTLGVEEAFKEAQQRWQRHATLEGIEKEKTRMRVRDLGFAAGLLAVLAGQGAEGLRGQSLFQLFRAKRAQKVTPSLDVGFH